MILTYVEEFVKTILELLPPTFGSLLSAELADFDKSDLFFWNVYVQNLSENVNFVP